MPLVYIVKHQRKQNSEVRKNYAFLTTLEWKVREVCAKWAIFKILYKRKAHKSEKKHGNF